MHSRAFPWSFRVNLRMRGIIIGMNRVFIAGFIALAFVTGAAPCLATQPTAGEPDVSTFTVADASVDVALPTTMPLPDRLQNLLMHAISLIGVKYKYGGSSADAGFDCSGFVRHVFAESAAIELPRSSYAMGTLGESVTTDDLRPGDMVFYNTRRRNFSHVGIYLGEGRFVHAPSRGKSVEIVDMSDHYWKRRFNGARRLMSVE